MSTTENGPGTPNWKVLKHEFSRDEKVFSSMKGAANKEALESLEKLIKNCKDSVKLMNDIEKLKKPFKLSEIKVQYKTEKGPEVEAEPIEA